jgi:hypothetical protein
MTDYLDATGVLELAKDMDPQHLECRVGRHILKPQNSVLNPVYKYKHNTYRCACGLVKHEITMAEFPFRVLDSWPDYPEGYLLHGVGRIAGDGRDVLKGVRMQRVFDKSNTERMPAKQARNTPPPRSKAKEALGYEDTTPAARNGNVVQMNSRKQKAG